MNSDEFPVAELLADDPETHKELLKILTRLRDEELHHHDTGIEHDGLKVRNRKLYFIFWKVVEISNFSFEKLVK